MIDYVLTQYLNLDTVSREWQMRGRGPWGRSSGEIFEMTVDFEQLLRAPHMKCGQNDVTHLWNYI